MMLRTTKKFSSATHRVIEVVGGDILEIAETVVDCGGSPTHRVEILTDTGETIWTQSVDFGHIDIAKIARENSEGNVVRVKVLKFDGSLFSVEILDDKVLILAPNEFESWLTKACSNTL